jgi:hypothetical protein
MRSQNLAKLWPYTFGRGAAVMQLTPLILGTEFATSRL